MRMSRPIVIRQNVPDDLKKFRRPLAQSHLERATRSRDLTKRKAAEFSLRMKDQSKELRA